MMNNLLLHTLALVSATVSLQAGEMTFVNAGKPVAVREVGQPWKVGSGWLECTGTGNFLYATKQIAGGDFEIHVRFSLDKLAGTAATIVLGDNHFGLDSRSGTIFLEGPDFSGVRTSAKAEKYIKPGEPVEAEIKRTGEQLLLRLAGKDVVRIPTFGTNAIGQFGLRPWRATMRVYSLVASGNLVENVPIEPEVTGLMFKTNVYVSGKEGYHTYRIPSLLVTPRGTVLAFTEGRKNGGGDTGDIDMLLRRSTDNGATWQAVQTVWNNESNTCGNPCPVVDRDTGTIWMLLTWNRGDDHEPKIIDKQSKDTRRVYVTQSTDDGLTWAVPREITRDVKKTEWSWYATGPGAGIQIEHGPHKGRLVIPCDHVDEAARRFSHVIYSDDHGQSWKLGGITPKDGVNECEVVELLDGRLMLNMRNHFRTNMTRQISVSNDGGMSWAEPIHVPELVEPICQGSIRRYAWPNDQRPGVILFSNPAGSKRKRITVRASLDEGLTWPYARLLDPRPSAYSCLAVLADGTIGLLYEAGGKSAYETIVFARLDLAWVTNAPLAPK